MIHRVYVMFELIDQKGMERNTPGALPSFVYNVNRVLLSGPLELQDWRCRVVKAESVPEPEGNVGLLPE